MTPRNDHEFEEALKQVLSQKTEDFAMNPTMQEQVLGRIAANQAATHGLAKGSSRRRSFARVGSVIASGAAAVILAAVAVSRLGFAGFGPSPTQTTNVVNQAARPGHGVSASGQEALPSLQAPLAPIATRGLTLVAGTGATAEYSKAAPGNAPQLANQTFTVKCSLYNASDQPIAGPSLQGMLFILRKSASLSPTSVNDWEYFVNGPSQTIPAHGSVSWSFTPNPAPPYRSLANRTAHMIWLLRTPNPSLPSLFLGTLPVRASNVRVHVISTGPAQTQFLRITAELQNLGSTPWSTRAALAMLFFSRRPGAALLSRGTYKYFDDISSQAGYPTVVQPGQKTAVQFIITGVPHTDMTKEPLTVLLVPRNQIGA